MKTETTFTEDANLDQQAGKKFSLLPVFDVLELRRHFSMLREKNCSQG